MLKEMILFIITFIFIYLIYIIFVLFRKNVLNKFINSQNIMYLKKKYNVNVNSKNIKKIANSVFLANSFILSCAVTIVSCFDNFIIGVLACIIPIILMIFVLYHIIGKHYGKLRRK